MRQTQILDSVKRKQIELNIQLYTNPKINFNSNTKFTPVNYDKKGKVFPLVFVGDYDDVMIYGSVGGYSLQSLVEQTPYMTPLLKPIGLQIAETQKTHDVEKLRMTVEQQLKRFSVTKNQLEKAYEGGYEMARQKWKPGADELLRGLVDRGFALGFISGSFVKPLQMLLAEKGISKSVIYGSEVEYDEQEVVSRVSLNLGENKFVSKKDMLRKLTSSSACLHIVSSDQMLDAAMGRQSEFYAGINPFLLVGKEFFQAASLTVHCPEAVNDLAKLLEPVDRWRTALVNSLTETPTEGREILRLIGMIKISRPKQAYHFAKSLLEKRRSLPASEFGLEKMILRIEGMKGNLKREYEEKFVKGVLQFFPEAFAGNDYREKLLALSEEYNR